MIEREPIRELLRRLRLEPQDAAAIPPAAWNINVRYPSPDSETTLSVLLRTDRPDYLIVRCTLGVSPGHRSAIQGMGDDQYRQFHFNLVRDLLLAGLAQYRLGFPADGKDLENVLLSQRVWEGAITLRGMAEALQAVYDSMLLAAIRIRHAAGEPA